MSDKVKELVSAVKRLTKTDNYSIKIETDKPDITDSKIGGLPYWTDDKEYPKGPDNGKLFLLAQINFEKEKVESPLPTQGMLQFFILDDDLYGLNFDEPTKQEGFKVIYHEKVDYSATKESIEKNKDILESHKDIEYNLLEGEFKFSLHKSVDNITISDYRFDEIFSKAYKEVYGKDMDSKQNIYNVLSDEEYDRFNDELEKNEEVEKDDSPKGKFEVGKHKMLGYPYFTQSDPRFEEKLKVYSTLLFQLDYENDKVMWGDGGVGNFFIEMDSLLKKDFSKVLFNWDCY